ncbi:alpha-ketoglutarate-dependent dioxygenase alkB 2 [Echria macrotheca]|uniref:Alpha-ketoglutarate-dependent dioxygenase alkB 2 n=1 Tax=Echria macrotheca TaxID=438768 RepID=A0AAJ0BBK2_9PEZI|nr:alpha-ketoglutarate-dependent dioxygenase alkB 2 [Echria macrotheca]
MPSMFPINPAALPTIPTRKALLIIDLQNDFVSPDGALPTSAPEGFVSRTLEVAKAFRDSNAGDVIWVRSEFERHRSLTDDGDQILVSDIVARRAPNRGRRPNSKAHDDVVLEADEEAFLSFPAGVDKPLCVRKDTPGVEFAPEVKEAVVTGRDIVFTKTHYSAFASVQQQLVQMLRIRFVTEMYICGALTNIGIYATALDAGRHGYDMTVIEDCCGYRNELRHINALRQLGELTGSTMVTADEVIAKLQPAKKETATPGKEEAAKPKQVAEASAKSSGLSPAISKMTLNTSGPSAVVPPAAQNSPRRSSTLLPAAESDSKPTPPRKGSAPHFMGAPLEAESDDGSADDNEPRYSSEEGESAFDRRAKRLHAARLALRATANQDDQTGQRPSARRMAAAPVEQRSRIKARQRQRLASPGESSPSPPEKTVDSVKKAPEEQVPSSPVKPIKPELEVSKMGPPSTVSEPLCEGDTTIITNLLPPEIADTAFDRLLTEVSWASMSHLGGEVPRRVAVQGTLDSEGNMPVYRHPSDESPPLLPFSKTVLAIKQEVEKHLGHPLNHVLIQHYRNGNDYISEHSDKTLDIVRGSFIANVSLGAERTMIFRTKRPPKDKDADKEAAKGDELPAAAADPEAAKRQTQRAPLPHNSLCRMGLQTNMRWLHAIRQDKRAEREKSLAELAHGGARISLTFRQIGTFLDASHTLIWGQGAVGKTRETARPVVNGQTASAVKMLQAFGRENHASEFDWDAMYGCGFDVLHMGTPKRFCAGTGDAVANMRVGIALAELGVSCAKGSVEGEVRFEDNDPVRTVVEGHETVIRYLDAVYGAGRRYDQMSAGEVARRFTRLQLAFELLGRWRAAQKKVEEKEEEKERVAVLVKLMEDDVLDWEQFAEEAAMVETTGDGKAAIYVAGGLQPSPADFALWPVLHDMVRVCGEDVLQGDYLARYYREFGKRSAVEKVLGVGLGKE